MEPPVCTVAIDRYPIGSPTLPDSQPAHTVTLSEFAIMQHAVSNALYAAFVRAGAYQGQQDQHWTAMGLRWRESKAIQRPFFWGDVQFDHAAQPVVGISWYEALAFSRWFAAETGLAWRLLSEVEWEAAARGTADDGGAGGINSAASGLRRPIGVFSGHVAWCGAINLRGNVWEWCSTRWGRNWQSQDYRYPYTPDDGREDPEDSHARVIRGGSWFDPPEASHPAHRTRYLPGSRASNIGFRLAYSL